MSRIITKNLIAVLIITLIISGILGFLGKPASASNTDGTIDSTYKYAWGENIGWINFGATEGNVHITDSALTGYAWAENIGWISLNCSNDSSCGTVDYKVANDGEGTLTGYAWSENASWINFNPTYGGVTVNSSGEFLGYAWGENIGWIVFNCSTTNSCATVDYKVKTDWRPRSARPACNNSSDDDGDGKSDYPADPGCSSLDDSDETDPAAASSGGAGIPPAALNPPSPPLPSKENSEGGFKVLINPFYTDRGEAKGEEITGQRKVKLLLFGGKDAKRMTISTFSDFSSLIGQIPYQKEYQYDLCNNLSYCAPGIYNVYVKFHTLYGVPSNVVSDTITLSGTPPSMQDQLLGDIQAREKRIEQLRAYIAEIQLEIIRLLTLLINVLRQELEGF